MSNKTLRKTLGVLGAVGAASLVLTPLGYNLLGVLGTWSNAGAIVAGASGLAYILPKLFD